MVPNPIFEDFEACPPIKIESWYSPSFVSKPDFYHPCNFSAPKSYVGHYKAYMGEAYVGIALIALGYPGLDTEHIQTKLIERLEEEKSYRVSFWVRPAHMISSYFIKGNPGLFFSEDKILYSDVYHYKSPNYTEMISPDLKAHISPEKERWISDTVWTEISGIYTAKGNEEYVTIGIFWEDNPKVVKAYEKALNENEFSKNQIKFGKVFEKECLIENPYKTIISNAEKSFGFLYPYYLIDNVQVIPID